MTASAGRPRSRPGGGIIAAALAIAAGLAVAVALLVNSGYGSESNAEAPDGGAATTVPEVPAAPTTGAAAAPASVASTTDVPVDPEVSGSSTTVFTATVVTVEADDATSDATDDPTSDPAGDQTGGGRGEGGQGAGVQDPGGTDGTAPTAPAPTSGTCRIAMAGLDGQSGTFDMGSDGTCGSLAATIQAVNPRDDLAGVVWGRDIQLCQRHPAASEVAVSMTTAATTTDIDGGLARTPDEGAADPIVSIEITFAGQATPVTGPRPVLACRTSTAELSIVHRPAS